MKKPHADMDPVEEIRVIRAEIMHEFKTLDALCEYLDKKRPAKRSPKATVNEKASGRRKPGKRRLTGAIPGDTATP